jgi:hypothetical protein
MGGEQGFGQAEQQRDCQRAGQHRGETQGPLAAAKEEFGGPQQSVIEGGLDVLGGPGQQLRQGHLREKPGYAFIVPQALRGQQQQAQAKANQHYEQEPQFGIAHTVYATMSQADGQSREISL